MTRRFPALASRWCLLAVLLPVWTGLPGKSQAAPCDLDQASYANKRGDYVLTFPRRTSALTTYPAKLSSKAAGLELSGDVVWTDGVARPYLTFYKPGQEELYTNEAYGLRADGMGGVVDAGFPVPSDRAPPAILLPNLSATLYIGLKPAYLPEDMFYLVGCK